MCAPRSGYACPGSGLRFLSLMRRARRAAFSVFHTWYTKLLGCCVPALGEMGEMMYQFENDFDFSSAKFRARFPDFRITSYEEGLRATLESLAKK
jgi:hypothetical protein